MRIYGINGVLTARVAGSPHPKEISSQDGGVTTNKKEDAMARLETIRQSRERWRDRRQAGQELSRKLLALGKGWLRSNTMVVALPRGGVPIALEVAKAFQVPLTTWSVRKLTRAQAPEVAVGAIATGGIELWDNHSEDIPIQERRQLLAKEVQELNRRRQHFDDGPIEQLRGKILIVVDDGIATGMTVAAALYSLHAAKPNQLILAIPVVDQRVITPLKELCDQLVTLKVVCNLHAVGEYFENFEQLNDADVINLLKEAQSTLQRKACHQ